jgi:LPS export ABC transporter protein LptC
MKETFISTILLLTLILVSCENEISKIKTVISTEEPPAITAEGFEMLASDSSVIRFKLQTPQLIYHKEEKDPYYEFPKGVKIVKYDSGMNVISSITAQYAKNFPSDDRWEAKNNVIAVNFKGDTLKTEYMVWDTAKKKIYSDQFVKIIQKDHIFTGIGFESNQDFSDYQIKNLKGDIYVNVDDN